MEKKNDDFRRIFHQKINKWDACSSIMQVDKRQHTLEHCKREKRKYVKKDQTYWEDGGKKEVIAKIPRITQGHQTEDDIEITPVSVSTGYTRESLQSKTLQQLKDIYQEATGKTPAKKTRKADIIDKILESQK